RTLTCGGLFGYRFVYPAMCVGRHEVYWQRPLVAYLSAEGGQAALVPDAPLGYLTAYPADHSDLARPVELWPRLLQRPLRGGAVEVFHAGGGPYWTARNVRKLLDEGPLFGGGPLPASFARQLVKMPKHETLADWLGSLPGRASDPGRARRLAD